MTEELSPAAVPRFWTARDANIRLAAGYLSDPEGPYAAFFGPNPAALLDTLDDIPCVVLLGEPGSGKTTALRDDVARLNARATTADEVLQVDLRDYAEVTELRVAVFEHPDVLRWEAGTHRLTLALDSLDEALIEMRKLATRLATELHALSVDRLRLRIACRTADWPAVLEHELGVLWPDGALRVMEIAPLRRRDVLEIAAGRLGAERAGEFLDAVATQNAEPFAAKPGTLGFLISSFAASARLPASQAELYTIGCRALCEETNPSRRAARLTGALSADERMAAAARVAAAMIYGSRTAVWMGLDRDTPSSDLRRADLVGHEFAPTGTIRIDEKTLRDEVLSTGLFSARGPDRLGWAHQTYGEFLAAWWIARRELTAEQVLALLTVDDGVGRKLVPQLHETAAWVATLRPDLFAAILDVEPWVLLRSDVARADPASRERLVAALVDAAERDTLPAPEFGQLRRYPQLRHPALGRQLATVIADGARADRVRDLALDIAIGCEVREVAPAAADLALDASAAIRLRATAAWAVGVAGEEAEASRLRPLALGSEEKDDSDELKGSALRATWRTIPPGELFAALSRARRSNVSGAYGVFLGELAESLSDEHVGPGLHWIERIGHAASIGEKQLEAAVILRAIHLLDDATVGPRLIRLVRRHLRAHQPLLDDRDERRVLIEVLAESTVRRRLLAAIVDDVVTSVGASADRANASEGSAPPDLGALIGRVLDVYTLKNSGYLADEDFVFVLDTLARVANVTGQRGRPLAWATLAWDMFDVCRADHANAVLERANAANVHDTFRHLIDPVDLYSADAGAARQAERERETQRQRWAAERAQRAQHTAERTTDVVPLPSAARLAEAVDTPADREHADDLPRRRWIGVFFELVRDEKGQIQQQGVTGEIRAGIAWREATASIRDRVVGAAAAFVQSAAAPVLNPDGDVHHHTYAWAGYVALRLVAAEASARLDDLDAESWARWAPTVARAEPYRDTDGEQEAHAALVRRARAAAPNAVDDAVLGAVGHALAKEHWRVPERVVTALAAAPLGDRVLACCLDALENDLRETASASAAVDPRIDAVAAPAPDGADAEQADRLRRAQARELRKATFIALFAALLEGGSITTRDALVRVLDEVASLAALDLVSPAAERAFIAAESLLIGADDAGWSVISKIAVAAPAFAKDLLLRSARHREVPTKDFRARLGVRGVGELFVVLAIAFPYETDPWHIGVYSPTARDNVVTWRRALLDALEGWGTPEAIAELRRIQAVLPQYDWLGFSVARAREVAGRAAWHPVSPAQLFALAADRRRRLVRNADDLVDLVVESLGRYQRDLQGDLPAVVDLWDYSKGTGARPRDEGHFADHVARFLKKDLDGRGIAVGCELVVRRGGNGRAPGRRTDIYVTAAVAAGGTDQTTGEIAALVIEVKGSWHDEVSSAMRTQLVEGYLSEHAGTRRGVYLVGDFTCDAWADPTRLRQSRALGGVARLQETLDAQAASLSHGGVRVCAVVLDASLPS